MWKMKDAGATLRQSKNTKTDYPTFKDEQKGLGLFSFYRKDWKWFNQMNAIYSFDQRVAGGTGASTRPMLLDTRQILGVL